MARVVLENLAKEYGERTRSHARAVNGINLTIESGEFMVLVGPSGCGKSTTLRMIAGLEEPTGGEISIDGRAMNGVAPKDRDIAMVFQNYALYPHMSVYDNLAFGLKLRNLPKAEIDARVRQAAALLGLEGYLERRPKALSGGQRQRVAVGRAIVRQPKVFLFDEPLSNLDARMRTATRAELSKLHARLGATMIYVTHDQVEAMTMGDRICVMKDGDIMQVAEPFELYQRPANLFVAGFIGSPGMNLFAGTVRSDAEGKVAFVADSPGAAGPGGKGATAGPPAPAADSPGAPPVFAIPSPAGRMAAEHRDCPVVLGVRPEDVHLASTAEGKAGGPDAGLAARVELSEPMGAETHLHLSAGGSGFLARVPGAIRYPMGAKVSVVFDFSRGHLFDPASGRVLVHLQDAG